MIILININYFYHLQYFIDSCIYQLINGILSHLTWSFPWVGTHYFRQFGCTKTSFLDSSQISAALIPTGLGYPELWSVLGYPELRSAVGYWRTLVSLRSIWNKKNLSYTWLCVGYMTFQTMCTFFGVGWISPYTCFWTTYTTLYVDINWRK